MPKLLKIVMVVVGIETLLCFAFAFHLRSLFWGAVNLGILAGFRTRSAIAWNLCRVIKLLGMIAGTFLLATLLLARWSFVSQDARAIMTLWWLASLSMTYFVFFALGHDSVREYSGTQRVKKEESTTVN